MAVAGIPWQLECENVRQRCDYLFTSGTLSDCIFTVGSETNQEVIQAHKLVLAMASPVFEAMFYGGLSESNDPIVPIPDVKPEAFRVLLQYIYTGNINIVSLDMAWAVLYGAKKYMLPHVVQECTRYISSVLGPRNACRVYEFAHVFDEKTVMDKCMQIICTHTKEVLNDSSFVDVDLKFLITVCSLDNLNVDSELDLFQSVARYAEAEQKRQGQITPPADGAPPSEELSDKSSESSSQTSLAAELDSKAPTEVSQPQSKPTAAKENHKKEAPSIREAIKKIRFLSMTAQEFVDGPARSGLLTKDESYALLMNIISKDSAEPLPIGFSECRERRQPRSDSKEHGFKPPCLENTISLLISGYSYVSGAQAAAEILSGTTLGIQQALDKGILDALRPDQYVSLQYKYHSALAISAFCAHGSPSQLRVLIGSSSLKLYCELLTDRACTCYGVLLGITDLLQRFEPNAKPDLLLKLREIGVPQLLITVNKNGNKQNREKAISLLEQYFLNDQ